MEALKRGYKMEHAGNLATFIHAHTNTPKTLMYSLTDLEANHFTDISHANEWEEANGIVIGSLSRICNPSLGHKYITTASGKYTVTYQAVEGGRICYQSDFIEALGVSTVKPVQLYSGSPIPSKIARHIERIILGDDCELCRFLFV